MLVEQGQRSLAAGEVGHPGIDCALKAVGFRYDRAVLLPTLLATLALATPPALPDDADAFCAALRQEPQERFMRHHYRFDCTGAECGRRHRAFLRFRTENYGYVDGAGSRSWNRQSPRRLSVRTTFMGKRVRLNRDVAMVLLCVERELVARCATCTPDERYPNECNGTKPFPYAPRRLSGLRLRNTYRGSEVSNHLYGIALDVDPDRNTCCGCVGKWRRHPLCLRRLPTHERMVMPMCWVPIFREYGFHWLGHDADRLHDTMHFEFLGDPQRIRSALEPAP